jgi:hypothetical protein
MYLIIIISRLSQRCENKIKGRPVIQKMVSLFLKRENIITSPGVIEFMKDNEVDHTDRVIFLFFFLIIQ